ncbi:hypothetical protein LPJ72_002354 [Coemansia sp. Benny D160-2]|nr:hypothetical protein LPJ72_002354 [Coemansia sp. Benny D160-2]
MSSIVPYFFTGFTTLIGAINFALVVTQKSVRFLLHGSRVPSWDFQTNLERDMFLYISQHSNTGFIYRASTVYWVPILLAAKNIISGWRYPCTTTSFQIPAVSIDYNLAYGTGRWKEQLLRVGADAVGSGYRINAERVMDTSSTERFEEGAGKAILYLHGGAYVTGSIQTHRYMHLRLSTTTKLPVFAIEYRLAPEFKYPTQLYDAYCAYTYLRQTLGYSSQNIVVAGDSAGGNLALALWQLVRAQGDALGALILMSPRVDISYTRDSWRTNAEIDYLQPEHISNTRSSVFMLLGPHSLAEFKAESVVSYVNELGSDPFLAPINADLSELPPTLIQASKLETMYSDICEFTARATAAIEQRGENRGRGSVELQVFPDGVHVFQLVSSGMRGVEEFWYNIGVFVRSLDNN